MPDSQVQDSAKQLNRYKEEVKAAAEKLVLEVFPLKIVEINNILKGEKFVLSRVTEFEKMDLNVPVPEATMSKCLEDDLQNCLPVKRAKLDALADDASVQGTKVMGLVGGVVPTNRSIVEVVDIVKPHVRDVVESVNTEETLAEVRTVEAEASSFLDQISRYYINRGRLITKVAKYPHIEDYRRSVADLDEKQFLSLRLVLMEVRNHYSSLHDLIVKNIDKIKTPRTTNLQHLY